ncbi:hypothetical protein [Zooshikella ganghwensis]|uniref:Uncharacterized protein n=1 Tax=Zooshikella ganghwensis TaxID=202772 RepID=A0A4P9VG69_9GAMM|nr:hypothetical protein [Zooshikella ganghwensis]RDH41270.1 hypothetical protein B9G39_29645 [Zooshikella ganghwensis]
MKRRDDYFFAIGKASSELNISDLYALLARNNLRVQFRESSLVNGGFYIRILGGVQEFVIEQGNDCSFDIRAEHHSINPIKKGIEKLLEKFQNTRDIL